MKKIFLYGTLLFAVMTMVSCQKEEEPVDGDGNGYVNLSINLPTIETRSLLTDNGLFDPFALRIYKTDGAKELIRHYHELKDVPSSLWLKNGNYLATVTLGDSTVKKPADRVKTDLKECCFSGEQAFEIKADETTDVEIMCDPKETLVEVDFDKSVDEAFDLGYRVCAMIRDSFNAQDTIDGTVPFYTFVQKGLKKVYFSVPDDADSLSYCFLGHRSEGDDIHEHKAIAFDPDKKAGYRYLLSFKYSKDAQGMLQLVESVTIDRSRNTMEQSIGISPDPAPTIAGNGVDSGEAYTYPGGDAVAEYTLTASGSSKIKSVTITTAASVATRSISGNQITVSVDNPTEHEADGITLEVRDDNVALKLAEAFFNKYVPGGESTMTISALDDADQEGVVEAHLQSSGATSLASLDSAKDKWAGKGEIKGVVYTSASNVKVQYREKDSTEWKQSDASLTDGNTYTASATGITAGHTYEYQLLIDGTPVGTVQSTAIKGGWQVPNGNFETWHENDDNVICPYPKSGEQWWDTGNHGSSSVGENVTTSDTGKKGLAAKLKSTFVIVKFAAGNIFVGKYIATDVTNGVIGFGKPFTPEYRPKKVTFWYKGTVGTINRGSAPGVSSDNSDVAQFYVMLCSNMTGPHIVATKDTETFMNFETSTIDYCPDGSLDKNSRNTAKDGHIVAKAVWENTTSQSEWTKVEVPLEYTEYADEMPVYILITASASKYGDYFAGSDKSVMYIDEVTFEY